MERYKLKWRESVKNNGYKCISCGTQLADGNGVPNERAAISDEYVQCPLCRMVVASLEKWGEQND